MPEPRRLLIATTNPGKVREIQLILRDTPVELLTLTDVPHVAEPSETGRTFAENARLKADVYASATGLVTVAEDSGLAIDALDGRPGVESARYPGATYPDKFANLYRELAAHPPPWTARYVCALAVVQAPGTQDQAPGTGHWALGRDRDHAEPSAECLVPSALFSCVGDVEGEIAPAPRGTHGFGYDPIFFYPPFGATFGEVTDDRKAEVSHRGRAFRQLRDWLRISVHL